MTPKEVPSPCQTETNARIKSRTIVPVVAPTPMPGPSDEEIVRRYDERARIQETRKAFIKRSK